MQIHVTDRSCGSWANNVMEKDGSNGAGFTVKVLSVEKDIQKRYIKEAVYTETPSPQINSCLEMVGAMKFVMSM